jgi:peptidoglycan/LPS O-acetylase OafA/YrhL
MKHAEQAQRRLDIQCLRALAVVAVVCFHYRLTGSGGGFMGVDVFFVISGYLMTKIVIDRLEQGRFSYLDFVAARAVRIVPALLAVVALLLALGSVWLPPHDLKALSVQAWSALFFVSNAHYLGKGGYFDAGVDERWLLHTWSLSVEWQFYLVYPLVLLALWHLLRGPAAARRQRIALACGAAFVVLYAHGVAVTAQAPARAFFSLDTRAWEMLGGGLVFLLEGPLARWLPRSASTCDRLFALLVALLLGFMLFAARHNLDEHWPGAWPLVTVALTMGLLTLGMRANAAWIGHAAVQALGRWSYSLYLWHWPLLIGLHLVYPDGVLPGPVTAAAMAATLLLGALSYRWIEQPLSRAAVRRGAWPVTFALVLCALALQGGNRAIDRSDGWMARTGTDRPFYERVAIAKTHAIMPASCLNFQRLPAQLQLCSVGPDTATPRILVYGDSHAQHLYAWFAAHAARRVDFMTSAGCIPAPGYNRITAGFHCDGFMQRVAALANDPRYDTIVVAGNWGGGMHSGQPRLCRTGTSPGCSEGALPTRQELVQANVRFWRALTAAGKRVYVVGQMPFASFDVPGTLARERFWHRPLTRSYQPAYRDPHPYIDDVRSAMAGVPGFETLEIAKTLCNAGQCRTLDEADGPQPTLVDNSHFAPEWIRREGRVVLAAVR